MYLNQGEPYHTGDRHRQPELANAFREIAKHGAQGFYSGPVAEDIVDSLKNVGGLQTLDDFAGVSGEWTEPIASEYRGYQLFECPPNGQGFIVSNMLNILSNFAIDELALNSAVNLHLQIEASRLSYADRDRFFDEYYASDQADKALEKLLSQQYGRSQSKLIDEGRTMPMATAVNAVHGGDTTYVAIADRDGNMISLMNSLYYPFGSGLVSETYGILLHNRGCAFEVTGSTQRKIEPGKRPPHTILPAMLLKDDQPVMTFGVVGAEHQPTGQVRMISALVDAGVDVQQALDAPRVFFYDGIVQVEHGFPDSFTDELAALGHKIQISGSPIGAGQAIWVDREQDRFVGGSDFRKGGCAMGF